MGGMHLHVRTCARADAPSVTYLGNSLTDCGEIWCVVRDPLAMRFTLFRDGVHLHVRTCAPLFRILGTAGRIALKFGMLLETNQLHSLHKPRIGYICTCARADVPRFPYLGSCLTDCAETW